MKETQRQGQRRVGEGDCPIAGVSGPASPARVVAPFGGRQLYGKSSALPRALYGPPSPMSKGRPHCPWSGSRGRSSGGTREAVNHAVSWPGRVGAWEPWQKVRDTCRRGSSDIWTWRQAVTGRAGAVVPIG